VTIAKDEYPGPDYTTPIGDTVSAKAYEALFRVNLELRRQLERATREGFIVGKGGEK
jgi:hypothetical protein